MFIFEYICDENLDYLRFTCLYRENVHRTIDKFLMDVSSMMGINARTAWNELTDYFDHVPYLHNGE